MSRKSTYDPYKTSDENTFANETYRKRWPSMLKNLIDHVKEEDASQLDEDQKSSLSKAINRLLLHITRNENFQIIPNQDDYNALIEENKDWTCGSAPWLFAECYLYQKLHEIINTAHGLKSYDVFRKQKEESFVGCIESIKKICVDTVHHIKNQQIPNSEKALKDVLIQALWGNLADLSFDANFKKNSQDSDDDDEELLREKLIVNDLNSAVSYLKSLKDASIIVVNDNAGYELFTDIIMAIYMLECGVAKTVKFHLKSIPWFVSDAMESDFKYICDYIEKECPEMGSLIEKHIQSGSFTYETPEFYTKSFGYTELASKDPNLFEKFKNASLVVFKGDLNYRKLTEDLRLPVSIDWRTAIGDISQITSLSMRTCKSDVIAGVPKEIAEKLDQEDPKWRYNGKRAVVMFNEKTN